MNVDSMNADNDDNLGDDDDSDLEAELLQLTGGNDSKSANSSNRRRPNRPPQLNVDLDAMVSESVKDIPSDEDISGDDDDPDLLSELNELTGKYIACTKVFYC